MALPVAFWTEVVTNEDGSTFERDIIDITFPDGTIHARLATDQDKLDYPDAWDAFKHPVPEKHAAAPTKASAKK